MTKKKTAKKRFKKGEKVWFYPLPTCRPRLRKQVTILEVLKTDRHEVYRTDDPADNRLFPTFHHASQFKKVK